MQFSKQSNRALTVCFSLCLLAACGSDDDDNSDFPDSYVQFYNGSSNSSSTSIYLDESLLGTSSYGDATTLGTIDAGEVELEITWEDSDEQTQTIYLEEEFDLNDGEKNFIVMSGDFNDPEIDVYTFDREEFENDDEDHFRLFALSVAEEFTGFDVYMAETGTPFESSNFLGSVQTGEFIEFEYWAADSDSDFFDEDEYQLFLTRPGESEVLLTSDSIDFVFETEYIMVLRETSGAIAGNPTFDLVVNSTNVDNYADIDASSQYRIYNSLDYDQEVTVTLDDSDSNVLTLALPANTISDFYETDFGDYRLSTSSDIDGVTDFNNKLLTLNQGESKAVVLYEDEAGTLTSISFEESVLPQSFEHDVNVTNLVPDYVDIDVYFVRSDETIDTAEYVAASLDYEENEEVTVPSGFYQIVAVFDDDSGNQILLDRTELLAINEEVNYIITVETSTSAASGFQISLLQ